MRNAPSARDAPRDIARARARATRARARLPLSLSLSLSPSRGGRRARALSLARPALVRGRRTPSGSPASTTPCCFIALAFALPIASTTALPIFSPPSAIAASEISTFSGEPCPLYVTVTFPSSAVSATWIAARPAREPVAQLVRHVDLVLRHPREHVREPARHAAAARRGRFDAAARRRRRGCCARRCEEHADRARDVAAPTLPPRAGARLLERCRARHEARGRRAQQRDEQHSLLVIFEFKATQPGARKGASDPTAREAPILQHAR